MAIILIPKKSKFMKKSIIKKLKIGIIISIISSSAFAQCTTSLGSASNFSIFTSAGAISNVSNSTIEGNIGTNVGTVTGFETFTVSGNTYIANGVTQQAATDLAVAYSGFSNMTPTITSHSPVFGGGETILPGIYGIGAAGSIAGSLTLNAQNDPSAKFILKFGGAFTSGANSNLILLNGATANNIYWIVNGAVSFAANTTFSGTIIVNGAISIGAGNNLNSKLLSVSGAISLYETSLTISGISNISTLYYEDADQDGFGNPLIRSCSSATGYILDNTDCDDTNAIVNPNAVELYGNSIDDNCNGIIDTDTSICGNSTIWNGSSWSNGTPSYEKEVIFFSNYTSTSDIYACSILVTNSSSVTFISNLFVYNSITIDNNSFLAINNNNNILQINPLAINFGSITVKRNSSSLLRLDHTLWSSPVASQNLYNFSPATLTNRFYVYDTTTNVYSTSGLNASTTFTTSKGYAVRAPNDHSSTTPTTWTGTFSGVPNNGTVPYTIDTASSGYNLVGNPYPSPISASAFLTENVSKIDGTLYFYAHSLTMNADGSFPSGTNYSSWNTTAGVAATTAASGDFHPIPVIPSGVIQVGQGFFVKATAAGNINFTNTLRVNDNENQFFRTNEIERHRLWLNLTTENDTDINQIAVAYIEGASQGVDTNFDGLSFGNTGSSLSSKINTDDYVIQGRSLPFDSNDVVALGFKSVTAGNYKIKLTNKDGLFLANQDVFVRDNLIGTEYNITNTPYLFTTQVGTFDNRFQLVYIQRLATPSETFTTNSVLVTNNSDGLHVATIGIVMKDISVYDISGRLLFKQLNINESATDLKMFSHTNKVLLLKITSQENVTVTVKAIN